MNNVIYKVSNACLNLGTRFPFMLIVARIYTVDGYVIVLHAKCHVASLDRQLGLRVHI